MEYIIFKHTRNRRALGITILTTVVLIVFGLCCMGFINLESHMIKSIEIWIMYLMGIAFITSALWMLWFSLSLKGLIVKKGKLFIATFIFGELYKSKPIDPSLIIYMDILKFDHRRNDQDGDHIGPDLKHTYYYVYGLNKNHSKRTLICETIEKEDAKYVTRFLSEKLGIEQVKYTPPTARRRKRRR